MNKDLPEITEAMTIQQRMKKRVQMRILAPKLTMARKRNAKRLASREKLEARAEKKAKNIIIQKIAKRPKSELSFSERGKLEDRIAKMKPQIKTIAKKLFKDVRSQEIDRLRSLKNPGSNSAA